MSALQGNHVGVSYNKVPGAAENPKPHFMM